MDDPITEWINELKAQDGRAAELLWQEYFEKLVQLARRRLGSVPRRADDEEDVALSAMNSFFRGVQRGRFPKLSDRNDLWRILVTITARKVSRRHRKHFTAKRGAGAVRGESVFIQAGGGAAIAEVMGNEPTPEFTAETADTCRDLIGSLADASLEEIVLLKLEGYTNAEIAKLLNCATRTIDRKLERVRNQWSNLPED